MGGIWSPYNLCKSEFYSQCLLLDFWTNGAIGYSSLRYVLLFWFFFYQANKMTEKSFWKKSRRGDVNLSSTCFQMYFLLLCERYECTSLSQQLEVLDLGLLCFG